MRGPTFLVVPVAAALTAMTLARPTAGAGQDELTLAPIVRTERSGGGGVRVVYELNGPAGALFTVSLEASTDGGRTFAIHPTAVTGDVGAGVSPGTNKTIAWDTTKDVDELQVDRFVFRVVVSGGGQRPAAASGGAAPSDASGVARGGAPIPGSTPGPRGAGGAKKGGGLSKGALIAIAGGGAAAGVGVAAKGKGGSSTPQPVSRTLTAQISAPITFRFLTCVRDEMWTGTLTLRLDLAATGTVTGAAAASVSTSVVAVNSFCGANSPQPGSTGQAMFSSSPVTGTTSRIVFSGRNVFPNTAAGPRTDDWSFSGTLASDVVSGSLDWSIMYAVVPGVSNGGLGTTTFNVTAR